MTGWVAGWVADVEWRAAAAYRQEVATLVNAWKERGHRGALAVLAVLLADAVEALAPGRAPTAPVELVAVPSRAAAVRARGRDATADLAMQAARELRRRGHGAVPRRRLRLGRAVRDQHGLGRAERERNLAGAMRVRGRLGGRAGEPGTPVLRIVVDDVVTTGATLAEAVRALRAAGLTVDGAAVVAATPRG